MTDFQDLLQDAEQMTAMIDKENADFPRLQRTLSQIYEVGKKRLAKSSNYVTSSETNEINASILLAGKGIDAPKLTQTIENLQLPESFVIKKTQQPVATILGEKLAEPENYERLSSFESFKEADIESFLKSERELALMTVIEEVRQQTLDQIEDMFYEHNESEWQKQKQKLMQEMLGSFSPDIAAISTMAVTINSRSASKASMHGRTLMSDIELEFSRVVYGYNQNIIEKEHSKPDLMNEFISLAHRISDPYILEAWNTLYFMTDISKIKSYSFDVNKAINQEQQRHYLDRDNSIQIQKHFVNQAIIYLEYCFKELIQKAVNANLKQAKLGGALGTLSLVSGYLRLSQSEKYHRNHEEVFDDKQPLWPTIYLCLRCGDLEAAHSVAAKAKKEDIAIYFEELIREKTAEKNNSSSSSRAHLSISSENKLKAEYKNRIKRSNEAYKRAVYCYLARMNGEDESLSDALDNVDDFLWFKLNSISITSGSIDSKQSQSQLNASLNSSFNNGLGSASMASNSSGSTQEAVLTFQEFQKKLSVDFGEKYFVGSSRNPFIYLQVLLLTSQFELAIEFMLKYDTLIVHAVHMAIALFERQMLNLNLSSSSSQLVTFSGDNNKSFRRINFPALIKIYTKKFESTDPREAVQYYYFLRNLPIPNNESSTETKLTRNFFAQYISELALETREFELMFGKLEKNSIRRPGLLDKYIDDEQVSFIIGQVADEVENKGMIEEAIRLHDLCKQHQRVLELCNKLIGDVAAEPNVANSARERIKELSFAIAIRYKTEMNMATRAVPQSIIKTFYLLVDLMTFFDLYYSESAEIAYETLNKLNILPITTANVEIKMKEFISFNEEVFLIFYENNYLLKFSIFLISYL
jgi:nuclear pore complex protein Nup93